MAVVRIRTNPDLALTDLHRRMEQMMARLLRQLEPTHPAAGWVPRVDVYETADRMQVTLELPGVEREGIEIVVEGAYLSVSGVRAAPEPSACVRWHQMEIVYGPFERILALPFEIDPGRIAATYRDGFLLIEIPKEAPRTVPVDAG
jgi:HSP20 family protein